jgi:hypothetical protein
MTRQKLQMLKPALAMLGNRLKPATVSSTRPDGSGQFSGLYSHRRWRRIREQHLGMHPLCVFCERLSLVTVATIVDHVEPHRGDMERFWHGERQSLCKPCHDSTKKKMEQSC